MFLKIEEFRVYESLKTAREIYKDKIGIDVVNKLAELDPSKTKKYVEKMCQFYLEIYDLDAISKLINSFDDLVNRKQIKRNDIGSYKDLEDFSREVALHDGIMSKRAKKQAIKDNDVEVVLDNADYYIISPKTHEAAQIYGAGTKWCITEKNPTYWERYTVNDDAKFYFVISKKHSPFDNYYKVAIGITPNGRKYGYDAADNQLTDSECNKLIAPFKDLLKGKIYDLERFFKMNYMKYEQLKSGEYNILSSSVLRIFPEEPIIINDFNDSFVCYSLEFADNRLPIKIRNIHGSIEISGTNIETLDNFPEVVTGKRISITTNNLKNIDGFPKEFSGVVELYRNELTSLKGLAMPRLEKLLCGHNELKTLEGCPESVDIFSCKNNKITSLSGGPKTSISYDCSDNKYLTSLKGGPNTVSQFICCNLPNLTSLEGGPKEVIKGVGGAKFGYECRDNTSLTSLKGIPKKIDGNLMIMNCPIENLEYFPKVVTGSITFTSLATKFTEKEIRDVCKVGGSISLG